MIYISLDAGGSKCSAILFDETFRLLGRGKSGGVNANQGASRGHARANVADCLDQLFAQIHPDAVDAAYIVFVGPIDVLREELAARTHVRSEVLLGEPVAGLYAGALRGEGLLAMAGTGSDIFCIQKDSGRRATVGGWGPILGDQGSGAWMGQRALRAAVAGYEGWGEKTLLMELILDAWNLAQPRDLVSQVYRADAPFRKAASVTPILGAAARAGDPVALSIVREAGEIMAVQAKCLIEREAVPEESRDIVCCGGAWRTHSLMFEVFRDRLKADFPSASVEKPWFEHVMAGPARAILERGVDRRAAQACLAAGFPDYVIDW